MHIEVFSSCSIMEPLWMRPAIPFKHTSSSVKWVAMTPTWTQVVSRSRVNEFHVVSSSSMGSIHLLVLSRKVHRRHISSVESHFEATGVGGVGRNKGGVGISFWLCHTPLCFVNAHLAAHQSEVAARNQDVLEIHRKLRLGREMPSGHMELAQRFQHIFWMGDLNYR